MTVGALAIAESVPDGARAASQPLLAVASRALELLVCALEGIVRELGMIERVDLEGHGLMTGVAFAHGRGQTKLASVHVPVAAVALAGSAAVGRAVPRPPVACRRGMATIAGSRRMRAGQRPSAVVDAW